MIKKPGHRSHASGGRRKLNEIVQRQVEGWLKRARRIYIKNG